MHHMIRFDATSATLIIVRGIKPAIPLYDCPAGTIR